MPFMQANQAVEGLKVTGDKKAAADQIKALYKTFAESDCTMVEVSTVAQFLQQHSGPYVRRLDACSTPLTDLHGAVHQEVQSQGLLETPALKCRTGPALQGSRCSTPCVAS